DPRPTDLSISTAMHPECRETKPMYRTSTFLSCRTRPDSRCFLVATVLLAAWMTSLTRAELVIEPVFNRVEGQGGADNVVGVRQAVNGIQSQLGIEPLWTAEPNEVFSYVTGDPRNPELDHLFFYNDTQYEIDGFGLSIIGTGTDTDDPRTIVRGAPIDARFGDVDGDGQILSDIFSGYTISADGKTIEFTGGSLMPGDRFTDIHLAASASPPEMAGIDSWLTGTLVPEPTSGVLLLLTLVPLFAIGRQRRLRGEA
ncbi:MAG: PEP-CTERM sorting domain-containing protein, partial [Planctomycetaceae bacterium]|nr:PEP-CTERM sorting domain-containing protein [Planctomycetaceae bacterium]